ncbi:hypothetical protein ABBQ32_000501 [Trebouxia sp. C0010 RCD-2024]
MLVKLVRTSDLAEGARVHREVHGRTVTVLRHNGKVYAIDTACFHQGGPLGTEGDIEDINGVACLRCPWHGYKVNLDSGGQVQTSLSGQVCEQHGKQRTHNVYDGQDGHYWVDIVVDSIPAAASDVYNLQDSTGGLDSQGFGLSSQSSTDTTFQPAPEVADSPGAGSVYPSNQQVNWGCQPFAGVGKRPLVSPGSSPVKQKPRVQADEPLPSLAFRGRRTGASQVRRKLATNAVLQNYKPPPTAAVFTLPVKSGPVQRTIDELFKRQNDALPAADTAADMELL